MKKLIIIYLLFFNYTNLLNAKEISKEELAGSIISEFNIEKSVSFNVPNIVSTIIQKEPQFTPYRDVLTKFYTKYLTWESLKPLFEQIIVREFSEQELININKFLLTPAFKAWINSKGNLNDLPKIQQNIITDFVQSDIGIHFFKVTEDLTTASKKFIGKVTLENKKELDQMIKQKTAELVKK